MVRYCLSDGRYNSKKTNRFTGLWIGSSKSTDWIVLSDLSGIQNSFFQFQRRMAVGTRKLWLRIV